MDLSTRILIVARPGHSRQSLVALLRTIQHAELFLAEGNSEITNQAPTLILVDLGGLHPLGGDVLKRAAQQWPTACKIALVDDIRQIDKAYALGADFVLPHDTPAGELLRAVQHLNQQAWAATRVDYSATAFAVV